MMRRASLKRRKVMYNRMKMMRSVAGTTTFSFAGSFATSAAFTA
jgi:hypothetical protein